MQIQQIDTKLPVKLEDLSKFVLIGREKLIAVKAEIRAIESLNMAKEVTKQKREEGRYIAEALLDAEAKIGQLLKGHVEAGRHDKKIPKPFTRDQSSQFQRMADHKEIIEQVKAEAIENDDLPTRQQVLNKIEDIKRRGKEVIDNKRKTEISYEDAVSGLKDFIKQLNKTDKLSMGTKENDFLQRNIFVAIDMYLDKFNNPNDKIRAGQNIIKHLKEKINEQHIKTI